ncbi:MAG TPA: hypothetical protein VFB59_03090 [Candidatus Saccharimonadales bacterium]|nr:hypothetical protein [Candidatus Saccharimonadales bacterium]
MIEEVAADKWFVLMRIRLARVYHYAVVKGVIYHLFDVGFAYLVAVGATQTFVG